MPQQPKRICIKCRKPVRGVCSCAETLKTTKERGYGDYWPKFRKWVLSDRPICEDCKEQTANEVHHIRKIRDAPHLRLHAGNVLALCKKCHDIRTARGE